MSSPNASGDPRTGRDRRAPTRTRTFQDGKVDPVITNKRPLLTIGNGVLLVVGIGYGMYATGHLPQLDAFFNHADEVGKANNSTVVNALITYGSIIVGCVLLALVGLVVFSIVNTHRRRASDPKGWEKEAKAAPERRKADRRQQEDLPSLIMPIGKERPERLSKAQPTPVAAAPADAVVAAPVVAAPAVTPAAAVAATPAPTPIIAAAAASPQPARVIAAPAVEKPSPAKLAAMEAAKKAEAAADSAPPDLPSFVLPYGKAPKPVTKVMKVQEPKAVPAAPAADAVLATAPTPAPPTPVQAPSAEVAAAKAKADAAIAAARAAALKAEAAVATAKAEAAIAIAKAEAAAAEAAIAAAKAEVQPV